jgi:hypothetical protein
MDTRSDDSSRSNWAKDSSTFSVSLPMDEVVLNCWVGRCFRRRLNGFSFLPPQLARRHFAG